MVDYKVQYLRFCLYEMYVNVDFVRCLYSAVSLTLVRVIENSALYKNYYYYILEREKLVNTTR